MYSPKIKPELVRRLYVLARDRKIPMTRIVNKIVEDYLERCSCKADKNGFKKKRIGSFTKEGFVVSEAKVKYE